MRNNMQQIRFLSEQLDKAIDPPERERIQEEIWELEEEMELVDEFQYKSNHANKYLEF